MACVVCGLEGDDCGPTLRTDCCAQPFHWNTSCARGLGIRARRGGPTGDLRCAPQCAPCEPPEDTADDWQRHLFDEMMARRGRGVRRVQRGDRGASCISVERSEERG